MQPRPLREVSPSLRYDERDGKIVRLQVSHVGRPGRILARFPDAVIRRAIAQMDWWQTRREYELLRACRGMDSVCRTIVREHLLLPRCQKIAFKLQRQDLRRVRPRRQLSMTQAWAASHQVNRAHPTPDPDRDRRR